MRAEFELDDDHGDGRDESWNQKMDRNWIELLQELRVTQTADQILGGFMLTLAFQPRFADLNPGQRAFYLALMTLAAATILAGLAPVYLHRALFRKGLKRAIVAFGHAVLKVQLLAVAVIVLGTVLLVLELAIGLGAAVAVVAGLGTGVVAVAASPIVVHRREHRSRRAAEGSGASMAEAVRKAR